MMEAWEETKTMNLTNWMGNLPSTLHSVPLNSLAIPGSHDSFASFLDKTGPLGPDNEEIVKTLEMLFGPMVKDIIYKWSQTQSFDITKQLDMGIRYFDMRIAKKDNDDDIYLLHGLYSSKLESVLESMKTFLEQHPQEIILIDINHTYNMNSFDHKQCMSMILEIIGYKMCPLLDIDSLSLETLWESNLQAVVFYHDTCVLENYQFWPGDLIPSPWPNVCDIKNLITCLEKNYNKPRNPNTFYVTQGILTPDVTFIIKNITSDLKTAIAEKACLPFVEWLRTKKRGTNGINVCIMDFVEFANYIPSVIAMNYNDEI